MVSVRTPVTRVALSTPARFAALLRMNVATVVRAVTRHQSPRARCPHPTARGSRALASLRVRMTVWPGLEPRRRVKGLAEVKAFNRMGHHGYRLAAHPAPVAACITPRVSRSHHCLFIAHSSLQEAPDSSYDATDTRISKATMLT